MYLVEVDAMSVRNELDANWTQLKSSRDTLASLAHARELARFGYRMVATERLTSALSWLDSDVDDAVLARAGGLEDMTATGMQFLQLGVASVYATEDLVRLSLYASGYLPLKRVADATAMMRHLRTAFDFIPSYARASAREMLLAAYDELAAQKNPASVNKAVGEEVKMHRALLAVEVLLRDGASQGRI